MISRKKIPFLAFEFLEGQIRPHKMETKTTPAEVVTRTQAVVIYLVLVTLSLVAAVLDSLSKSGDAIWMALLGILGNCACLSIVVKRRNWSPSTIVIFGVAMFLLDLFQMFMCVINLPDPYATGLLAVGGIGLGLGLIVFAVIHNGVAAKRTKTRKIAVEAVKENSKEAGEMEVPVQTPPDVIIPVEHVIGTDGDTDLASTGAET